MTDRKKVVEILLGMAKAMEENKELLTDLDSAIGDSDHGINMARGFAEVEKQAESLEQKDIGNILKTVGMTLVSKVGGSSGPLYGTAFMKAGMTIGAKDEIDMADFLGALEVGIEGVKARGKSTTGEKTMLDAMVPALDAMKEQQAAGADAKQVLEAGVQAAEAGVEATKPMVATKGRASYLGERSIGHQDPGATSFTLLLKEIAKVF
ncbi:MAG: dihydroxyacetone kinase subunit DhaL [Lachnospiraceae bacterium]